MKCYFAPMQGVTGYVFRKMHNRFYGCIDEYYTPFIVPNQTRRLTSREMNDILPEHNQGVHVVPQILTNHPENFMWAAGKVKALGYEEVNLNLGCPSGTVVSKGRGAGFLAYPQELDRFLDMVSESLRKLDMRLSVKTRIGVESPEEFEGLLRIFNRYPLEKMIIHPRVRTDYYRNAPNLDMFRMAVEQSVNPLCYNGDLFSAGDFNAFCKKFPGAEAVMLGRGLLANPALAEEINGMRCADGAREKGFQSERQRLRAFHDALLDGYREAITGDRNVLFKMKEVWFYLAYAFEDGSRHVKKIRKAQKMTDYLSAVDRLFSERELSKSPAFSTNNLYIWQ